MKFRQIDTVPIAAAKSGFSSSSAYRIDDDRHRAPHEKAPRLRRRPDPLAGIWENEIVPILQAAPGLRPIAIFEEILRRHPQIGGGVRRTLERRVRAWRAVYGPEQEVIFRQVHEPGRMGLSDFTEMSDLAVTIELWSILVFGVRRRPAPRSLERPRRRGSGRPGSPGRAGSTRPVDANDVRPTWRA